MPVSQASLLRRGGKVSSARPAHWRAETRSGSSPGTASPPPAGGHRSIRRAAHLQAAGGRSRLTQCHPRSRALTPPCCAREAWVALRVLHRHHRRHRLGDERLELVGELLEELHGFTLPSRTLAQRHGHLAHLARAQDPRLPVRSSRAGASSCPPDPAGCRPTSHSTTSAAASGLEDSTSARVPDTETTRSLPCSERARESAPRASGSSATRVRRTGVASESRTVLLPNGHPRASPGLVHRVVPVARWTKR